MHVNATTNATTTKGTALAALATLAVAWLLCLALAPLPAGAGEDGWRLQVQPAAVAQEEHVTLGDIVLFVGEVPEPVRTRVAGLQLWKSPDYPGRQQAVTQDQLERLLKYYAPDLAGACVLPSRLVVQRGGFVFTQAAIRQAVVDYLTPRLAAFGGTPELRDMRLPGYIFMPDKAATLDIEPSSSLAPGPVAVTLSAKGADGRVFHRAAASLFADLWKTVPCAARPLRRLEEVTPDKVTFMRKNLAYVGQVWDGRGGPFRITRSIGTGQPLTADLMESVPMVAKGERVDLVYQGRTVRLVTKAEALGDAEFGQMVEVRNLTSNRTVVATVLDSGTVQVR
jgi:flagella basal body P-ring formation protein FlgA